MTTSYKVKLQNFEGPLDLLLFFVRKDELNIYDIPISYITKQYLDYLSLMRELNLDIAAEFILMAATLMRIKVRSMLPPDPLQEEEEEILDPREELTRRLIEYRQFKEASKSLAELDDYWRTVYRRSYFNFDLLPQQEEGAVGLKDISFFDLLAAYKKAVSRAPKPIYHSVEKLNVTVEGQIQVIVDFFQGRTCYLFTDLCGQMGKIEIVVTFLAMLDLIKRGDIAVKQASLFDDIWIYKAEEFFEEDPPGMAEPIAASDVASLTEPAPLQEEAVEERLSANEDVPLEELPVIEDTDVSSDDGADTDVIEPAELGVGHELFEGAADEPIEESPKTDIPEPSIIKESESLETPEENVSSALIEKEETPFESKSGPPSIDTDQPVDDEATHDMSIGQETSATGQPSTDEVGAGRVEQTAADTIDNMTVDTEATAFFEDTSDVKKILPETVDELTARDEKKPPVAIPSDSDGSLETRLSSESSADPPSPIQRFFSKIVTFVKRIFFR
jgi:segregation and condensation protein A